MFIQVITAKVTDADGVKSLIDRWDTDVRPGADGFLGSTSGTTEDGKMIVLARFDSEESAQRNSDRPEQGAWWAEMEKLLDDVEFKNSVEVITMRGGGTNDAGFVQVMCGRVIDQEKADEMRNRMSEFEAAMAQHRSDVLGDVTAVHADGSFTDAIYFTSESEARVGEAKEMPADIKAMFDEFMAAFAVDEFLNLKDPRLI